MLSQYKFGKELGQGFYGVVYFAKNISTGKDVAIKAIPIPENTPHRLNKIINEVYLMEKLKDCNGCVKIYDAFYENNWVKGIPIPVIYIVMEYLKGYVVGQDVIDNYKYDEKQRLIIFFNMVISLKEIHDKGISHIDIKPENVMIKKDCTLKIIDFGFSCVVKKEEEIDVRTLIRNIDNVKYIPWLKPRLKNIYKTLPCIIQGTPAFMANEFVKNESGKKQKINNYFKADIWSLGITGFEFVNNSRPLQNIEVNAGERGMYKDIKRKHEFIVKIVNQETENKLFAPILNECFTFDPRKRITITQLYNQLFSKNNYYKTILKNS